jgi:hypothetical protein
MTNPMTTLGDLIVGSTAGAPMRLAAVAAGQILISQGVAFQPIWSATATLTVLDLSSDLRYATLASAPTAAPAGTVSVYAKTDKKLYQKDDAGLETLLGGGGMTNPMTSVGDLIVGTTAGAPSRLAAVATGRVLASAGVTTAPVWSDSLKLGLGTIGTSGARVIALGGGTAPTTSPVDTVQLWGGDFVGEAGSHGLEMRAERGGRLSWATYSSGATYLRMYDSASTVGLDVVARPADVWIGSATNHPISLIQNNVVRLTLNTDATTTLAGRLYVNSDVIQLANGPNVQMQAWGSQGVLGTFTNHDMMFYQNGVGRLTLSTNGGIYCSTGTFQVTNTCIASLNADGGSAYLTLNAPGYRTYVLYGIGNTPGYRGNGSFTLAQNVAGEFLSWDINGEIFMRIGALGVRRLVVAATDSGGPGYRLLVVGN